MNASQNIPAPSSTEVQPGKEPLLEVRDLQTYWKILADTGVLLGDDYIGWPGVTRAANQFALEMKLPIFGKLGKFVITKGKALSMRITLTQAS